MMNIKEMVSKINSASYFYYNISKMPETDLNKFVSSVKEELGFELDQDYLSFLSSLNGFEMNGLNFYGTKENNDLYVLDAITQNQFWNTEMPKLKEMYIIGDGDIDFYCFNPQKGEYFILTKGSLENVEQFCEFNELMKHLFKIYA